MVALNDSRAAQRGRASLAVELVAGESTVTSSFATSPMKLLTPRSRGKSVWAYTSSFGGGLVAGDQTQLDLQIGKDTRCFVGTQASTKIYRNPSLLPSGHTTCATVEENAVLIFAPDPVQAFAESTYMQRQSFHLAANTGLVLVDWFTSGRAARGERWAFNRFQSLNEVFLGAPASRRRVSGGEDLQCAGETPALPGERVFLDSLLLDSSSPISSNHVAGRFNCFAMLLFIGPPMRDFAGKLLEEISHRPIERQSQLICSASPVRDGALLRIAGESVEQVGRELHHHLQPLSALLGDDPWARKW